MNLYERQESEHREEAELGYARARASKYGYMSVSERRYAIIEFTGLSADLMVKGDPLGMKRFKFVEGCERLTWPDMMTQYKALLRQEIEAAREQTLKDAGRS